MSKTVQIDDKARELRIRTLLLNRGIKLVTIADRLSVSQPFVTMIVQGSRRSRRVEQGIARMLGVKREDIFPK